MRNNDFFDYCCKFMSPYVSEDLAVIYQLLTDNDICDIELVVNGIMTKQDDIDSGAYASLLINALIEPVVEYLSDLGVVFYNEFDEINIKFFRVILENHLALKDLDDTTWVADLIDISLDKETETDNREIYYDIQVGISEGGLEDFYEYISSVTNECIETIREDCHDPDMDFSEEAEEEDIIFYSEAFIKAYKDDEDIKLFINRYFDLNTKYTENFLLADGNFKKLVALDNSVDKSIIVFGTFLILSGKKSDREGSTYQEDTELLGRIASLIADLNDVSPTLLMKPAKALYTKYFSEKSIQE